MAEIADKYKMRSMIIQPSAWVISFRLQQV